MLMRLKARACLRVNNDLEALRNDPQMNENQ